ncbi:MAG: hypothetical protein A2202_00375 [Bdellovibrionales bacterium RIFOXYA1_FULL_36_14]|nr:MAG: hypothetical protein A2202_00375 [Bdellovibrionales bacterium RIFOXYA1_FULL_36_14]
MIKTLIFSVSCLFLFSTGINLCYSNSVDVTNSIATYSDIIDDETAQELLDTYQLIRDRKRTDAMILIDIIVAKLDPSIPTLESTYKRLKRVKFNVRKRRWYRATSIFEGILKDLNLP